MFSQKKREKSKANGRRFNTTHDKLISKHLRENAYLDCWENMALWSLTPEKGCKPLMKTGI